jgi:ribonuclease J
LSYVRIIPLGGVREFGLNSTVIETSRGSVLIDAGLMFPRYNITGIDQIIPDFKYVIDNQEVFQGILLTHGHEDHIGALPYLLKDAPIPVYGHEFTLELVKRKLREFDMDSSVDLIPLMHEETISISGMDIRAMEMMHSTMGCLSFSLMTPQGMIVHSGDFRYVPEAYGTLDDVRLFLCESTNAESEPAGKDEAVALSNIEDIVGITPGAVIVTTFSSHVRRIQSLYDIAVRNGRRVCIIGRSMNEVVEIASDTGHLKIEPHRMVDPDLVASTDRSKLMIICTGAQGEVYSALALIARGWHRYKVKPGDSVIFSARMIPGNEFAIGRCIDSLLELGACVHYQGTSYVHATGHATHDEIRKALDMLKPEILMPVHGEFRHMKALGDMAIPMGISDIVLARPGQVWTLTEEGINQTGEAPYGKCFVDGELTGDISDVVLRDRRHISEGGLVVAFAVFDDNTSNIVFGPDVMCKGVVPAPIEQEIMDDMRRIAKDTLTVKLRGEHDIQAIQGYLREELSRYLRGRLKKKPMIIPIIMEI